MSATMWARKTALRAAPQSRILHSLNVFRIYLWAALFVPLVTFAQNSWAEDALQNCSGGGGVGGAPTYLVGEPVRLIMCRNGVPSPYLGTLTLTSSDPTIVLPAPYTYAPGDNRQVNSTFGPYWNAQHDFGAVVVFRVPGKRTINFTFSDGGGVQGYSAGFEVAVIGSVTPVPTLQTAWLMLVSLIICLIGGLGVRGGRQGRP